MLRLGIFTSQIEVTTPPVEGNVYRLPINPTYIDPMDSHGSEWFGGFQTGGRYERYHDNRERKLVWKNLPSYNVYNNMINYFSKWVGLEYIHFDVGNSLLPGLYVTGYDWKKVSITRVETGNIDGTKTINSGGIAYDTYSTVTVYFELLGDACSE